MCDWRMKKGGHKLSGGRKDKGEGSRERKEVALMEQDKWKELACSQGWLALELSPSISYNSCSSRVTQVMVDI